MPEYHVGGVAGIVLLAIAIFETAITACFGRGGQGRCTQHSQTYGIGVANEAGARGKRKMVDIQMNSDGSWRHIFYGPRDERAAYVLL